MQMRLGSALFERSRGSGPRSVTQTVHFPREVQLAAVGMVGYTVGFAGDDHHVGLLDIRLSTEIDGDLVMVTATFGLRDWSGNWDDDYEGTINFVVLADLASAADPRPRGDLVVTGMEVNQATQHFRSARHLDGPNVRPDNSVPLVARKNTGVRVYIDYDRDASLPMIASLSGTLEVTAASGASFNVAPLAMITPRRDLEINRAITGHTLNFLIPEAWCQGDITLRCRVFDAANSALPSRARQATFRFHEHEPLRVYAVGVHYTGQGLDLPAPAQSAVVSTLGFVEKTYPVAEVFVTGYSPIDFNKDMKADISDGCGDGFGDLLGVLRDMRGSSSDVYYAVLPGGGIDSGSVGGCGGGGVGAGFVGGGNTAAQEIGHAFGIDHAPCDSETRCGNPSGQDDNYPQYNGFASDSIGEFGFDPTNGTVFDPATNFDFMGYSGPNWVSPYTYENLLGNFPSSDGSFANANSARSLALGKGNTGKPGTGPEWLRKERMALQLDLTIHRDRTVERRHSFHFASSRGAERGRRTPFQVELLDSDGRVLTCQALINRCLHCHEECWPMSASQTIPFPAGAKRLLVREADTVIHDEDIPDPPRVRIGATPNRDGSQTLTWSSDQPDGKLWYLVQWEDRPGEWRGLAGRTQDTSAVLPATLLKKHRQRLLSVRVLASSGIATGAQHAEIEIRSNGTASPTPAVEVVDVGHQGHLGPVLTVSVRQEGAAVVPNAQVLWFANGAEIGRGRTLDLRSLPLGQHVLSAVVLDSGYGGTQARLLIECGGSGKYRLLSDDLVHPIGEGHDAPVAPNL